MINSKNKWTKKYKILDRIFTSTSITTVDLFFVSTTHVQFILFGYSFGNIGLIKFKPSDEVILRFEQTSITPESKKMILFQSLFVFFPEHTRDTLIRDK